MLLGMLQDFFDGQTDPEEWHTSILKVLYKKGDPHNPTNFRGICLKDMTVRIMSAILNARLLKLIAEYGVETQYGSQPHRGTLDGLAVLRTALETRRYHGQGTWTLFVDLVKAFDTANHQLLFALLRKYGAPEKLVRAVETLYTDVSVKIQVGKEKRSIPYTIGVQQGDNMAPVLFVFLMQAFAETLEKKWKGEWGINSLQYRYLKQVNAIRGRLRAQSTTTAGTVFELIYLLYVDDGVFMFETEQEMVKGADLIAEHFKVFGLKMHYGKDGGKSKTEAMYFPGNLQPQNYMTEEEIQSKRFPVQDGYVTMTKRFKYLGSWIVDDLRNDYEVEVRLKKATQQVGALAPLFHSKSIPIRTKYLVYVAIPLNTALWGCESWSITGTMERRLTTFHHTTIRRILGMNGVDDRVANRISNKDVRRWFFSIADILDTITKRQLQWIGKVAQMDHSQMPRNLLMSWTSHKRPGNQPQTNYRKTYSKAIHQIVEECNPLTGAADTWMHIPQDDAPRWTQLINEWYERTRRIDESIPAWPTLIHEERRKVRERDQADSRTTSHEPPPQDPGAAKRQTAPSERRRQ
jgi:hypothetical protein